MPKEVIPDVAGMYDVTIGWSPERYVQVGITTHDGRSIVEHLSAKDDDGNQAQFTGLWGTLERDQINHVIRVLRRARNAVYGSDE